MRSRCPAQPSMTTPIDVQVGRHADRLAHRRAERAVGQAPVAHPRERVRGPGRGPVAGALVAEHLAPAARARGRRRPTRRRRWSRCRRRRSCRPRPPSEPAQPATASLPQEYRSWPSTRPGIASSSATSRARLAVARQGEERAVDPVAGRSRPARSPPATPVLEHPPDQVDAGGEVVAARPGRLGEGPSRPRRSGRTRSSCRRRRRRGSAPRQPLQRVDRHALHDAVHRAAGERVVRRHARVHGGVQREQLREHHERQREERVVHARRRPRRPSRPRRRAAPARSGQHASSPIASAQLPRRCRRRTAACTASFEP